MPEPSKRPLDPALERQLASIRVKLAQALEMKNLERDQPRPRPASEVQASLQSIEIPPIEVLRDPAKKKRLP